MTRTEYKKALEIIRDNRDNLIEVAIGLNEMVIEEPSRPTEEKSGKAAGQKKTLEKKAVKAAGRQAKRTWKPKTCVICGKMFQPANNRQMKCEKCKDLTVEQDTKNTAAELAAMMRE